MSVYLVKNIAVNNNQSYEVDLPLIYSEYAPLSAIYLRPHAFNMQEVTYDFEKIELGLFDGHTQNDADQPYCVDLVDKKYSAEECVKCQVQPMPKSMLVAFIDPNELDVIYNGDVSQAIFEYLISHLQLDFYIKYNK